MIAIPSLYGLVLAGGASTRMGKDKAALVYHGQSQLQWAFDLLSSVCMRTFISVQPEQSTESTRANFPQIVDKHLGIGPIAGIGAALEEYPQAAWLVLACDLPFLSRDTLAYLMQHRDHARIATAYRSAHDNLPEPLCTIWEPTSRNVIQAWIAADKRCPRKLLINSNAMLLDQPNKQALENINTPEEWSAARAAMS